MTIWLYQHNTCNRVFYEVPLEFVDSDDDNSHSFSLVQASGVTVSDVCKTTYEEIKKDKKHRYVIFYIRDEKQIDVEVIGERDAQYDAFLEDIQKGGPGECR